MHFYGVFGDGQAKPGAGDGADILPPVERLKESLLVGFRDADTFIPNVENNVLIGASEVKIHGSTVQRILDGIREQVGENVPQLLLIHPFVPA